MEVPVRHQFETGEEFENYFGGKNEPLHFEVNTITGFDVNLANAFMAQPKGHDPESPISRPLRELFESIKSALPVDLRPYLRVFDCRKLPIDWIDGIDYIFACLHPDFMSMVTADLTISDRKIVSGKYRTDFLITPLDLKGERFKSLSDGISIGLQNHVGSIPPSTIDIVSSYKLGR